MIISTFAKPDGEEYDFAIALRSEVEGLRLLSEEKVNVERDIDPDLTIEIDDGNFAMVEFSLPNGNKAEVADQLLAGTLLKMQCEMQDENISPDEIVWATATNLTEEFIKDAKKYSICNKSGLFLDSLDAVAALGVSLSDLMLYGIIVPNDDIIGERVFTLSDDIIEKIMRQEEVFVLQP